MAETPDVPMAATRALEEAERESLRAKAREHRDDALGTLSKLMKAEGDEKGTAASVRRQAANDLLIWGYGRPGVTNERGQSDDGGLTVIINQFGDGPPPPAEKDVTPPKTVEVPKVGDVDFSPMEYDVEELAGAG